MLDLVTDIVRFLMDDYLDNIKLIHHPFIRCLCSYIAVLQGIPKMIGAHPVVYSTKPLFGNGTKRKGVGCDLGIMCVDTIFYGRTRAVTILDSA